MSTDVTLHEQIMLLQNLYAVTIYQKLLVNLAYTKPSNGFYNNTRILPIIEM